MLCAGGQGVGGAAGKGCSRCGTEERGPRQAHGAAHGHRARQDHTLREDGPALCAYIKAIPVDQYPGILKSNLETSILDAFLTVLHMQFLPDAIWCTRCLQGLAQVERFSMCMRLLPKASKEAWTHVVTVLDLRGFDVAHMSALKL